MRKIACTFAAIAFAAAPALAQDAAPAAAEPAAPAGPATPAEEPAAAAQASVEVTDAEVDSFAQATVKLQVISEDASLDGDAKQQQMVAAVTEVGLDPQRYTEIGRATATDTGLRTRIQTAMAKYGGPGEG